MAPSGDYLDKDELVRDHEPMGIKSVTFDTTGSTFGPRWVCSIEPWYEGQDGPMGLLTFTNNPTRQPVFEDLQAQIEEAGNQPIGPVVLIKAKSQAGFRFYTFADYDENQPAAVATEVEVERIPQPKAPAPIAARTATRSEIERAITPAPRRGRPLGSKNRPKENGSEAITPTATTSPTSVATKPPEREVGGQEQILSVGEVVCPQCEQLVRGRVLRDETGKGVIIHPHCPKTGKAEILLVEEPA